MCGQASVEDDSIESINRLPYCASLLTASTSTVRARESELKSVRTYVPFGVFLRSTFLDPHHVHAIDFLSPIISPEREQLCFIGIEKKCALTSHSVHINDVATHLVSGGHWWIVLVHGLGAPQSLQQPDPPRGALADRAIPRARARTGSRPTHQNAQSNPSLTAKRVGVGRRVRDG